MYPCFNDQKNFGAAISGILDPKKLSFRLNLYVNSINEPDVRINEKPIDMEAYIVVKDLTPGTKYIIYRYNDHTNFPTDSNFKNSKYDQKHIFVA